MHHRLLSFICVSIILAIDARGATPRVRVDTDAGTGSLTHLGWDAEGRDRAAVNLLRAKDGFVVRVRDNETWRDAKPGEVALRWTRVEGGFDVTAELAPALGGKADQISLTFSFEPRTSAVTVLPASVDADQTFHLPAIVSAPGSGQMLVTCPGEESASTTLVGSRAKKRIDWTVTLKPASAKLQFRPVILPAPNGLKDTKRWDAIRREWFNVFQINARWGDPKSPGHAPAGTLANNVISDPLSSCLYIYADLALFTPQLAPGVSLMNSVAHTFDYWVDQRMLPSGEVYGYWDYNNFTDTNPSLLISAWDYVEATGDKKWAHERLEKIEKVAEFMFTRDLDHDGLVEAVQSGNAYTLKIPARSCSAHDAVNCGHKDSYSNLLVYRALHCLADLEKQLGRNEQAARYWKQAALLKQSFRKQLLNPKTGWFMMWRSRDGAVHDPAAPWVNCLAIQYGIVDKAEGLAILKKLRAKMDEKGFKRFDLGIPTNLEPIPRGDYLIDGTGCPKKEDGSDTFGYYINGGVITGDGLRYPVACYTAGWDEEGDRMLDLMLARNAKGDLDHGGFPVNVVDSYPQGGEFFTWEGKTCGYEGLLTHMWQWVGSAVLREPQMRARLYRPLIQP